MRHRGSERAEVGEHLEELFGDGHHVVLRRTPPAVDECLEALPRGDALHEAKLDVALGVNLEVIDVLGYGGMGEGLEDLGLALEELEGFPVSQVAQGEHLERDDVAVGALALVRRAETAAAEEATNHQRGAAGARDGVTFGEGAGRDARRGVARRPFRGRVAIDGRGTGDDGTRSAPSDAGADGWTRGDAERRSRARALRRRR